MNQFIEFKKAVQDQFNKMAAGGLFTTAVNKDDLWQTYLGSFPEGTNPIFRERTEHDCQCCKQFIRACGNVVAIVDNKLTTVWDVKVDSFYQVVADAMAEKVHSAAVENHFLTPEAKLGTDFNHQQTGGGVIKWSHFFVEVPSKFIARGDAAGTALSKYRSDKDVTKRGLEELPLSAIDTVIELIEQNSLYRGDEHLEGVKRFRKLKVSCDRLPTEARDNFCWTARGGRIRNTVIGSLLVDIAAGVELDAAVRSFETKVAPANYKRPTALVTKGMIENAQKKVEELGVAPALARRFAVADDLTINNVLFADRTAKRAMNVFEEMAQQTKAEVKSLEKVAEVSVLDFIKDVLPRAETLAVMFENRQENNLMSLIAPQDPSAPHMFKWKNNFSWAYNGEVADSIKERVKRAGGDVTGVLRCSLAWFNADDLDIHLEEPNGNHIYFGNKGSRHASSGMLDVDMNAGGPSSTSPVENITYSSLSSMPEGKYRLFVNQYNARSNSNVGFTVEIEFGGAVHTFQYDRRVVGNVGVAEFEFTRAGGIKFLKSLPSAETPKEAWGITTGQFHNVSLLLNSPNHWDGEETGNKHLFFILSDCKNPGEARGFFNEFLDERLTAHRKVFEVLGSKMKAPATDQQLSGLGFSSTQKNHVFCKVTGTFNRIIKIIF